MKTESELMQEREAALRAKEEKEKISRARKEKMRELEKRAALHAQKSDVEIADIGRKQQLRALAEEKMDNNSDIVKMLNSMAQRAMAFTVRDQQLEEKARLEKLEKEHEKHIDMLIEIDRLKDIVRREEEENAKRVKRVEDRKVINEQIEARQRLKLLQLEAREQENLAMRNTMKKYAEEDEVNAQKRKVLIEKSKEEVMKANADAIRRKEEAKLREKQEMEDILLYQALKDAEIAKREEEEMMVERMKKERQAQLLAQQEKVQNNAGKLDELRARRAAEEKERQERAREKAEAIKRKADMKELLESRAKQAASKIEYQKQLQAQAEEEIYQQMEFIRRQDEREERERSLKAYKSNEHKVRLKEQIDARDEARR